MKKAGLADSPFFSTAHQPKEVSAPPPPDETPVQNNKGNNEIRSGSAQHTEKDTVGKGTRKPARALEPSREKPSDKSRGKLRGKSRDLPTRDEIQEFSFSLRDELKVKVQAEVPYKWQKELEEMAHKLDVKKLELYRFILGEFLGKVKQRDPV